MIVVRTPLRVTLGGGGTDLQSYYQHGGGFIFALALDKYIRVVCQRPLFDARVIVNGPEREAVERSSDVKHKLIRAALLRHGINDRFEIASIADIAGGTGLGSSSCFLVGLLNAIHAMKGETRTTQEIAEEACDIEIGLQASGIGKQDQYMAAFGGLTTLEIAPDGKVEVKRVVLDRAIEDQFIARTHIYYTGLRRDAAVVLADQNIAMKEDGGSARQRVESSLDFIKDLGYRILDSWKHGDFDGWGHMLDEHWRYKKQLSSKISWPHIDEIYDHVRREHGVLGGKVLGAGGGGFLMLYCAGDGQALEAFMARNSMPRLHYGIDRSGSVLIPGV